MSSKETLTHKLYNLFKDNIDAIEYIEPYVMEHIQLYVCSKKYRMLVNIKQGDNAYYIRIRESSKGWIFFSDWIETYDYTMLKSENNEFSCLLDSIFDEIVEKNRNKKIYQGIELIDNLNSTK